MRCAVHKDDANSFTLNLSSSLKVGVGQSGMEGVICESSDGGTWTGCGVSYDTATYSIHSLK